MRAIFIDAFNQKLEDVDLPMEVAAIQKEIRNLLRTDHPKIVHSNELLTVIYRNSDVAVCDATMVYQGLGAGSILVINSLHPVISYPINYPG